MAKSSVTNTVAALGIPALFLFLMLRFNSSSDSNSSTTPPKSAESKKEAFAHKSDRDNNRASSRAALKDPGQQSSSDQLRPSHSKDLPPVASADKEPSSENLAPINEQFQKLAAPSGSLAAEENLEAELGQEQADYYRKVHELAFREYTEEDEKKEIQELNTQLAMNSQQDQATGLVLENARTAYAQQQRTVQEQAAKLPAKQRLAAYVQLSQFRRQFIFDRMKSILSPDQLAYYQAQLAEQQIAEEKALH